MSSSTDKDQERILQLTCRVKARLGCVLPFLLFICRLSAASLTEPYGRKSEGIASSNPVLDAEKEGFVRYIRSEEMHF